MFIVDDDFLPSDVVTYLKDIIFSKQTNYFFNEATVEDDKRRPRTLIYGARHCNDFLPQFTHVLSRYKDINSPLFDLIVPPIIQNSFLKHNLAEHSLTRSKINIMLPSNSKRRSTPHIDNIKPHLSLIYYVNDSDGDTVIYNQKYGENFRWLTVKKRIKPKAGRFILFDGLHFHSATAPSKASHRCVVNINLLPIEEN